MTGPTLDEDPADRTTGDDRADDPWARWDAAGREVETLPMSKAAVTSLVLGILSVTLLAYVFGIVGLFATGRNRTRRGRGFAWAGIALATVWLAVGVTAVVRHHEHSVHRDAAGHVTHAGGVGVSGLRAGDCLRDPVGTGRASRFTEVPCATPHRSQVVTDVLLRAGGYDADELRSDTATECKALAPGLLAAAAPPDLRLVSLVPEARTWAGGDRTGLCIVVRSDPLVTSVVG